MWKHFPSMHACIEVTEWVGTRNMIFFGYVPSISSKYGLHTKNEEKALINQHASTLSAVNYSILFVFKYIKPGFSYPFWHYTVHTIHGL